MRYDYYAPVRRTFEHAVTIDMARVKKMKNTYVQHGPTSRGVQPRERAARDSPLLQSLCPP